MRTEFGICNQCHKNKPIQNKKKRLCADCVYINKHGGKTRFEVAIEKKRNKQQQERNKQSNTFIKRTKKIGISDKQRDIKLKLAIAYKEIDEEREKICTGCGSFQGSNVILSHSHIISQKDCKIIGKQELIYDKRNITYHCLDFAGKTGCHRIHESKDINIMKQLQDFEHNLAFIKVEAEEIYNRIVNR